MRVPDGEYGVGAYNGGLVAVSPARFRSWSGVGERNPLELNFLELFSAKKRR